MAHEFAPNTTVYEEDPKLAAEYLISGRGYWSIDSKDIASYVGAWQPPVIAPAPQSLAQLPIPYAQRGGVLLVHERRTPAGVPKLMCVFLTATERGYVMSNSNDRRVAHDVMLTAHAFTPADPNSKIFLTGVHGVGSPASNASRSANWNVPSAFVESLLR